MTRLASLIVLFAILVSPMPALAQPDKLDHGEGAEVGVFEAARFTGLVQDFFDAVNALDGSAADFLTQAQVDLYGSYEEAVTYFDQYAFPVEHYDSGNVLRYEDGFLSVDVLYSGLSLPAIYRTNRFYVTPVNNHRGYALDHVERLSLRLPEGMVGATVDVTLSDDSLTVSTSEVEAADVLILNMENTSTVNLLSTGVYVLPDGIDILDAQAQLAIDLSTFEWLGGTPTTEGSTRIHAFVVEPGTTYLIQHYAQQADGNLDTPTQGPEATAAITVSP